MRKAALWIFLILLLYNVAWACMPAPTALTIKCTIKNETELISACISSDCKLNVQKSNYGTGEFFIVYNDSSAQYGYGGSGSYIGAIYNSQYRTEIRFTLESLRRLIENGNEDVAWQAIQYGCEDDLSGTKAAIINRIKNEKFDVWEHLSIERSSSAIDSSSLAAKINPFSCFYTDITNVDGWAVIKNARRPYCGNDASCQFNLGFFSSMINLIAAILSIGMLVYEYKKHELKTFLKPSTLTILVFVLLLIFADGIWTIFGAIFLLPALVFGLPSILLSGDIGNILRLIQVLTFMPLHIFILYSTGCAANFFYKKLRKR